MEGLQAPATCIVHDEEDTFVPMVGQSKAIIKVFNLMRKLANSDSTVLITGESGTGKELVARNIHDRSRRATHPFVAVNCGAIPEQLMESELFGHVRGSFSGAFQSREGRFLAAKAGTIFLDEIGEMSPKLQVKLLRVLQEREVDPVGSDWPVKINARVVAATNCDLPQAVDAGRFRQDLFHRVNILPMEVPPLRDRREDIPLLIAHFLNEYTDCLRGHITITEEIMTHLVNYDWPGNVRELQNLMERFVTLNEDCEIQLTDLPSTVRHPAATFLDAPAQGFTLPPEGMDIDTRTDDAHRNLMGQALDRAQGNKTAAAGMLGLNRTTFVERMRKLGLGTFGSQPHPTLKSTP